MLNESVLEALTRDAPLTKTLLAEAWPDLAVESKLQLISAFQESSYRDTPTWIMQLAITDKAAIVRYWAARHYTFSDETEKVLPIPLNSLNQPILDFEKELVARAVSDSSELVKACASKNPWIKENQLNRLVFIRSNGTSGLVSGLNKAFEAGFSDDDLADSFRELIAKKEVLEDLKFNGEYREGDVAHYQGEVVKDGWALVAKAGPKLQRLLALHLPTYRGFVRVEPETLASMSVVVLKALAYRPNKTQETEKALALVMSSPDKYGEETANAVKKALAFVADSDRERSQEEAPSGMQNSNEKILKRVEQLSQQITNLAEQMSVLQRHLSAKRGLFF